MDLEIISKMISRLLSHSEWNLVSLAQELNCTTNFLDKCIERQVSVRRYVKKIEARLAEIYCATPFKNPNQDMT